MFIRRLARSSLHHIFQSSDLRVCAVNTSLAKTVWGVGLGRISAADTHCRSSSWRGLSWLSGFWRGVESSLVCTENSLAHELDRSPSRGEQFELSLALLWEHLQSVYCDPSLVG
jgi:hypothetical protein